MAPKSQKALSSSSLPTHVKEQKASSKKRKSEQEENGKMKKNARVFTPEDEIAILQGMIDSNSSAASRELLTFLKDKLSGDFSYTQLYEKIRRLREKFPKNKKHSDSLEGHDASIFDLSVQIWGKDEVLADSNEKKEKLLPVKVARGGEYGGEDSAKNRLREAVACFLKRQEMELELARLDYEQMMKE